MEWLLPEWAPNIHPLLIHFPIVLLITATLFELAGAFKRKDWLRNTTVVLFGLGAVATLATYISGKQAIDEVTVPLQAEITAGHHADWALYTLLFFSIYFLVRLVLFWKKYDQQQWMRILLVIVAGTGLFILAQTADLGGKLVYKYGVGTVPTSNQ